MISEPEALPPRLRLPPNFEAQPAAFSDDLKQIIESLRRRWWLFLLVVLVCVGGAAAWIHFAKPRYVATATIVLDPRRQVVTNSPEVLSDISPDSSVVDTQVQLIRSRAVLGRVVDGLGLEREVARLAAAMESKARSSDRSVPATPRREPTREDVIDALSTGLTVERVGLSSALHVRFEDADPMRAADVANSVSAAYLEYQTDLKQGATKDANLWLRQRATELQEQVQAADAAVDTYRSRSGLLTAKGATSTESQLSNLDSGLNEARQSLSDARAKLAGYQTALRRSGAAEAAQIVASPTMLQLRSQFSTLANQRSQLSPTLGARHPQMLELARQLETVQEQMNAEARRTISELTSDVTIAQNRVAGLQAIRDQSRTQLAQDNAANVELTQLTARADSLHELYEGILTRLQQTTSQETLGQVNATVVSKATIPEKPSSPKVNAIAAGGAVVGVAFGALAVLLAQVFDTSVLQPKDFERRTRLPVLAMVPRMRRRDLKVRRKRVPLAEIVLAKPLSLFAESFRTLRVSVMEVVSKNRPLVVQVTSGTFGEGKTICSIAFAQTAAMDGLRVLLIDADVRRRCLTEYLGITVDNGLVELLNGSAQLHEVIIPGGSRSKPHVLPLSANEAGSQHLFSSEAFVELLGRLRKGFDLIVIDSAPVLAVAESLALATRVDVVVVATRWRKTSIEIVLKALQEIDRVGGRIVGTVLTQVDVRKVTDRAYGRDHYPAMMKYYRQ